MPRHLVDPGARGSVETAITIAAMASACLLIAQFRRRGLLRDLLLFGALGTLSIGNFAFVALPALVGVSALSLVHGTPAQLLWQSLVAAAFLAAASAPPKAVVGGKRRPLLITALVSLAALCLVTVLAVVAPAHPVAAAALPPIGVRAAVGQPIECAFALAYAAALLIASFKFVRRGREDRIGTLLGAAVIALAGVRLQYLALPVVGFGWMTPGEGLRAGAYALMLFALVRQWAQERRDSQQTAISEERQRIASDLHDGLAQDLAFIALHGQRFASELGPEHPLSLAAERALAAARGTIVDLSASGAPSTEAALERVAAELEARFSVRIEVQAPADDTELDRREREQVVRIVREAIVNSIRHGAARRIRVTLDAGEEGMRLTVSDDGRGFDSSIVPVSEFDLPAGAADEGRGFGLPAMQARAASLGGSLVTRRPAAGGAELELLVS
jgi:signal transduction histidine kinase